MQSVTSRIWTRGAVSISYDDNHYITSTSLFIYSSVTCARTLIPGPDRIIELHPRSSRLIRTYIYVTFLSRHKYTHMHGCTCVSTQQCLPRRLPPAPLVRLSMTPPVLWLIPGFCLLSKATQYAMTDGTLSESRKNLDSPNLQQGVAPPYHHSDYHHLIFVILSLFPSSAPPAHHITQANRIGGRRKWMRLIIHRCLSLLSVSS